MEVRFKGTRAKMTYDAQKKEYVALPTKPWTFASSRLANVEIHFVPNEKSPCDASSIRFIQIVMHSSRSRRGPVGRKYDRGYPTESELKGTGAHFRQMWRLNNLQLKGKEPWSLDIFPYLRSPFYNEGRVTRRDEGVFMVDTPGTVFDIGSSDRHFEFQTYAVCRNENGTLTFLGGMRWGIQELQIYSWVSRLIGGYAESHNAWRPLTKPSVINTPTSDMKDVLDLFNREFKSDPPWKL